MNEAFSKIADYGRVPIGLEIAGDVMPRRRTAAYSLDLAGLTWSALFTLLDRYQSGHEVTFMKGVPVVRPFGAANLDASLLNRRVEKFAADGRSLDDVLFDLMAAIEPDFRRPSRRPSPERFRNRMPERYESIQEAIGRRITLKLSGVSVVEVLNAVVEEHGGIWWRVRRQSATTSFELRGFDGWGFGVELKTGL